LLSGWDVVKRDIPQINRGQAESLKEFVEAHTTGWYNIWSDIKKVGGSFLENFAIL
jgi:hypothetical protein